MRKINRRDYLLQMGAGSAGLVASSELPLFGQERSRSSNRRDTQSSAKNAVRTPFLKWPVTYDPPEQKAFITVIYAGLSCFVYNDRQPNNKFVEVAFHHGNGGHELQIQVYKNPPDNIDDCMAPEIVPSKKSDELRFEVSGQTGGTANVFQADSKYFDRNTTDAKYKYDFRWMPDLHSPDFYPEAYGLHGVTGTRLAVPFGTFYTRVRTTSTFWTIDRRYCDVPIRDFGPIALYMATAIDVDNDVLLLKKKETLYEFKKGNTYQIVFYNECEDCTPDADDCDEKKRNDFHFNRDVVDLPLFGRLRYSLKVKDGCTEADCAQPNFCIRFRGPHRLTDEAPCSGSGYGKAPGYP